MLRQQSVRLVLLLMLLTILTSWLTGCATSRVISNCPPLEQYDREFELQMAQELRENKSPALSRAVVDYGSLRAQIKAVCDIED